MHGVLRLKVSSLRGSLQMARGGGEFGRLFATGKLGMLFSLNDETFGLNDVIGDRF